MTIRIQIAAADSADASVEVSTTIEVSPRDSRWHAWLVDAVTAQAHEGARRLCDQLVAQHALPGDGFLPLAAVVPDVAVRT